MHTFHISNSKQYDTVTKTDNVPVFIKPWIHVKRILVFYFSMEPRLK